MTSTRQESSISRSSPATALLTPRCPWVRNAPTTPADRERQQRDLRRRDGDDGEQHERDDADGELDQPARDGRRGRPQVHDQLAHGLPGEQHHRRLHQQRYAGPERDHGRRVRGRALVLGEDQVAAQQGRRGRAGQHHEEHVARRPREPAPRRHRGRQRPTGRAEPATPPGGVRGGEHGAEERAQGVGQQVVDVEQPVGAGVDAPHAGELGDLDEQRHREAEHRRDHDPAVGDQPDEHAEREEEHDVQHDLEERLVLQQLAGRPEAGVPAPLGRPPDVVGERHHLGLRLLAGVVAHVGQRQQRVGPQRDAVDRGTHQHHQVAGAEPAVAAVLHRRHRDEQQHRHHRPEDQRRDRVGPLVTHGPRA